jgi:hypothetical protein
VEGPCEHGIEPGGSIKCWGNSRVVAQLAASQEELSSMEFVKLRVTIRATRTSQHGVSPKFEFRVVNLMGVNL